MSFSLTKHHGLGNDFLVLLTDASDVVADGGWPGRARAWCDRSTGVGADGLLLGLRGRPDVDLEMTLYNADGSVAEMSGNGIRCLAQAEARRRGESEGRLRIATGGGMRTVDFGPDPGGDGLTMVASVDMGPAAPGPVADVAVAEPERADASVRRALGLDAIAGATFDLGNPHLVLRVPDPDAVDLLAAGPLHEATFAAGVNVHFVAPTSHQPDAMDMRVWERGAGDTGACGTGAVAVARAAFDWGLVDERVTVHMRGGDVVVDVGDAMVLHGPAVFVADVEVPA